MSDSIEKTAIDKLLEKEKDKYCKYCEGKCFNECMKKILNRDCVHCGVHIEKISNFERHMNRKRPCIEISLIELKRIELEEEHNKTKILENNSNLINKLYNENKNYQRIEYEKMSEENQKLKSIIEEKDKRIKELELEIQRYDKCNNDEGYVYIVYLREFMNKKENTYKIGRTKQEMIDRLKGYPKGSKVIKFEPVKNTIMIEKELIKVFKEKYIQRVEYGNEYFSGEIAEMIREFRKLINEKDI
jgi:hypothetical protein